jgi:hypothetical protein
VRLGDSPRQASPRPAPCSAAAADQKLEESDQPPGTPPPAQGLRVVHTATALGTGYPAVGPRAALGTPLVTPPRFDGGAGG